MSEQQIIKFRAVDRPLSDEQMEFMDQQSSRAEFTKWEFEVEYHYSSFRGDIDGMLRNGYDVFLNYCNYGVREIRIRLPGGLPFAKNVWEKYIDSEWLTWSPDKTGKGGILSVAPRLEDAYDPVWEFDDYLDAAAKLREMLIHGDLRALYFLWLCNAISLLDEDEELSEPPVPHGLGELPDEVIDLLAFFEVDPYLVDAAANGIPRFNAKGSQSDIVNKWLATIAVSRRKEIIQRLIAEDPVALKAELLSEIRDGQQATSWPVEPPTRTYSQLSEKCDLLRREAEEKEKREAEAQAKREAEKAEKERQARMVEMRSDPNAWLKKASKLVEQRSTSSYVEAADILADLRDAVGGEKGNKIVRKHAASLAEKNPKLNLLKSSLRKKGLLD